MVHKYIKKNIFLFSLVLVVIISYQATTYAELYTWKDKNGVTHITKNPPPPDAVAPKEHNTSNNESLTTDSPNTMADNEHQVEFTASMITSDINARLNGQNIAKIVDTICILGSIKNTVQFDNVDRILVMGSGQFESLKKADKKISQKTVYEGLMKIQKTPQGYYYQTKIYITDKEILYLLYDKDNIEFNAELFSLSKENNVFIVELLVKEIIPVYLPKKVSTRRIYKKAFDLFSKSRSYFDNGEYSIAETKFVNSLREAESSIDIEDLNAIELDAMQNIIAVGKAKKKEISEINREKRSEFRNLTGSRKLQKGMNKSEVENSFKGGACYYDYEVAGYDFMMVYNSPKPITAIYFKEGKVVDWDTNYKYVPSEKEKSLAIPNQAPRVLWTGSGEDYQKRIEGR